MIIPIVFMIRFCVISHSPVIEGLELNNKKSGMIINASRSIIFAAKDKSFAEKAREEAKSLKEKINKGR